MNEEMDNANGIASKHRQDQKISTISTTSIIYKIARDRDYHLLITSMFQN